MTNWSNFLVSLLSGGLGNQMFKFAAAYKVSEIASKKLILDLSWYNSQNNPLLNSRAFALDLFPEISSIPNRSKKLSIYKKFIRWSGLTISNSSKKELMERNYELHLESKFSKIEVINGSFESLKYLPNRDDVLKIFRFNNLKTNYFKDLLLQKQHTNSLAIHVRMGDYKNFQSIYGVLDISYYLNSLEIVKSQIGDVKVALFSDDPKEALLFLGDKIKIDFAYTLDKRLSAVDVLELMSSHQAIITANSTFSWWASYLGYLNRTCKLVLIPSHFYSDLNIKNDLIFQDAIIVPSNRYINL